MAASATFALKSGEWFRRVRFVIFAPDSHAQPCALSGRDSTHRTDRNCGATSMIVASTVILAINKAVDSQAAIAILGTVLGYAFGQATRPIFEESWPQSN